MEQSIDASPIVEAPPPTVGKARHKILFLSANPLGTSELTLGQEARAIQEELERSGEREHFQLVTRWAVQPLDLLRELRKLKPTIVHFSGHGHGEARRGEPALHPDVDDEAGTADEVARGGLCFQGEDGRARRVPAAELAEAFAAAGSTVKLVVLSACYSELQAQALTAHVACVVGMAGSIRDDATRYFAIGLYGGLGECESVATAFRQGLAAMRLKGIAQCSSTVHLLTSPDTDASKVYIVEAQNKRRRCSIVIKATLNEFDTEVIARVRDQLRLLSGDLTLEITDVREGSVILEIALSSEAAERLEELSERGELTHVLGFEVSSIRVREISAEVRSAVAHNDPDPDVDSSLVLRAGANLTGKDLRGSDLRAAQLTGARLARANLTDATLIRANLRSANLCGATLQGAQLDDADLHRANLIGANLAGANLTHVNLSRADLTGADLTGADLTAADLTHADFTAANLTLANLTNATLTGADLTLANLTNATLTGADLTHANLTNATLSHVKVARANVRHADVADVVPYGTNVSGADHSDTWDRGALVGLVEADRWTDDWPEGTVPESDQGRTIGWAPVPTAPPSTASTDSPPLPPADSPPSTSKKGAT